MHLQRESRKRLTFICRDALQRNGVVIAVLAICKLSGPDSNLDALVVAEVCPFAALVAIITLASMFGGI